MRLFPKQETFHKFEHPSELDNDTIETLSCITEAGILSNDTDSSYLEYRIMPTLNEKIGDDITLTASKTEREDLGGQGKDSFIPELTQLSFFKINGIDQTLNADFSGTPINARIGDTIALKTQTKICLHASDTLIPDPDSPFATDYVLYDKSISANVRVTVPLAPGLSSENPIIPINVSNGLHEYESLPIESTGPGTDVPLFFSFAPDADTFGYIFTITGGLLSNMIFTDEPVNLDDVTVWAGTDNGWTEITGLEQADWTNIPLQTATNIFKVQPKNTSPESIVDISDFVSMGFKFTLTTSPSDLNIAVKKIGEDEKDLAPTSFVQSNGSSETDTPPDTSTEDKDTDEDSDGNSCFISSLLCCKNK
jgi:hypothetical protein